MVILFLTGCLEPGRDGVGDHSRLLARECVRQGHTCLMAALNDPHITAPVETTETDGSISILRLPARMDWAKRIELAVAFRARQPVDWISLHFVAYAFDPKGMAHRIAARLAPIIGSVPLHIMFHELWTGGERSDSLKHWVIGNIQRIRVRKMVQRLHPRVVTTSIPYYRMKLDQIGITAHELPLFSNVAVFPPGPDLPLPGILVRAGVCDMTGAHPGRLLGLFFGGLHLEWQAEPFMSLFIEAAAKSVQRPGLIAAGRLGATGETVWKNLQKKYSATVDFTALGEISPRQVSSLMHAADFGLSAAPPYLLGKSSTTATMLDHGLPVIVTRTDSPKGEPPPPPTDPLVHYCDAALAEKLAAGLPRRSPRNRLQEIAADFLRLLAEAT